VNVSFDQPWFAILAGLILLIALILSRGRIFTAWIPALRTLALVSLALAVAGFGLERREPGLVVLADVSDSTGGASNESDRNLSDLKALQHLEFAGQAGMAGTDRTALEPFETDIAAALEVARAYKPARVLLVSDGNITRGETLESLPGVPVDVLPITPKANARVIELIAPSDVSPGATVRATAVIETTHAARVRVLPSLNGRALPVTTLEMQPGRSSVPIEFTVQESGEFALEVRIVPNFEQPILDDSRRFTLRSNGKQRILVIGDPGASRLLRAQGFEVRDGTPADVREPFNPPAVVIRGAATTYGSGQLKLLERYVLDGGGLMMTGGPGSFGLGGWARSPVERALPVRMDLRTRVDVPLVALVMVIDRSLSMLGSGGSGGATKLSLAIEGASNVIELAGERDQIGLVTFSDTAKWAFKPVRASDANKDRMLEAASQIQSDGGTILGPTYQEAILALEQSNAAIKHLILLTDGQLADNEGPAKVMPNFASIAASAKKLGITTSSIALGGDADVNRLRQIAKSGGGRFYAALDADNLPRIFTAEALTATRTLVRLEGVKPKAIQHPLLASRPSNSGPIPRLSAYIASSLQEGSEPILEGLEREPIIAVAHKGLGRSAAATFDLNKADSFTRWPELPALLGTITRWLEQRPAPYRLSISPDGTRAVVDAVSQNKYLNNERLELRVNGQKLELPQTAPGRYEIALPKGASGNAVLVRSGEAVNKTTLETRSRELEQTGGLENLRRIAQASGGRVLENLDGYVPESRVTRASFAPWLALLAAVALVAELALRRWRR
jgi:Ca-activated chloride channel homolog